MRTAITILSALVLTWVPAARAGTIRLTTADGVSLAATGMGSGERGVVLVHDADRSAADWAPFALRLSENGFSVVTVDLRGHGANQAAPLPDAADWSAMVADVDAAVAWLGSHGASTVSVVGAGLGGSLALHAAAQGDAVHNLVILSPTLNAHGVKLSEPLGAYTGKLLLVADSKDAGAARTATLIGDKSAGQARVDLVAASTSGHRMLNAVTGLEATLVGWLNGSLGEGAALAKPDRTLEGSDPGEIQTTGTSYGERP